LLKYNLTLTAVGRQVENREARACLQLKLAYFERACKCASRGLTFSTDAALQDQTLETLSAVHDLQNDARDRGILNPTINKIVTRAEEISECANIQTLETLRSTEQVLDRELNMPSGPNSSPSQSLQPQPPPTSLPVNKPN
jgi:hypothetical protein